MENVYTLNIAGLTRQLPICKVNDKLSIAAFIMFSDVELTVACATELLKKCPEFDVIVTAEAKGIPLAYEMSRQSGKRYIPARKGPKLYMAEPVIVEDQSITTAAKQRLVLDKKDLEYMNGKRVLIVDDVIPVPWWARRPRWPKAMQPTGMTSSSWSRCPCFSTNK